MKKATIKFADGQIQQIVDIESIEVEDYGWPSEGSKYYYIVYERLIKESVWVNAPSDKYYKNHFNIFETKADAERFVYIDSVLIKFMNKCLDNNTNEPGYWFLVYHPDTDNVGMDYTEEISLERYRFSRNCLNEILKEINQEDLNFLFKHLYGLV